MPIPLRQRRVQCSLHTSCPPRDRFTTSCVTCEMSPCRLSYMPTMEEKMNALWVFILGRRDHKTLHQLALPHTARDVKKLLLSFPRALIPFTADKALRHLRMESNFQIRNNEGSISCVVRSHDSHVTVMWLSLQEANGWCEEGVYDQLRKMLGEMVRRTAERGQFHLCCCVYIAAPYQSV